MSEESHGGGNVVAGVIAALVILGLVAYLFATLAKESVGSVAILMLPMVVYGLWSVVHYTRTSGE